MYLCICKYVHIGCRSVTAASAFDMGMITGKTYNGYCCLNYHIIIFHLYINHVICAINQFLGLICYCVNEWTVKQKRYLIDDLDVACIINMVSAICGSFLVGLFFDRDMHQYDQYPHSVHTKIAYQVDKHIYKCIYFANRGI